MKGRFLCSFFGLMLCVLCSSNILANDILVLVDLQIRFSEGQFRDVHSIVEMDEQALDFKHGQLITEYYMNLPSIKEQSRLTFYKNYFKINYPEYTGKKEKLIALRLVDTISFDKNTIEKVRFVALKDLERHQLITKLNIREVTSLDQPPISSTQFTSHFSGDAKITTWVLNFNQKLSETEIRKMTQEIELDLKTAIINCTKEEVDLVNENVIEYWRRRILGQQIIVLQVKEPFSE